ncbi:MAG: AAA family ATPase [Sutterellaceae bacterium]|nr:AAA family ATPase [Sutterellaceae bacterium]
MITGPRQTLPIGQSDFAMLRQENCVYVDKTDLIFSLCESREKIFLVRPSGFGKSLLVSTFESLFKYGLRDFKGLAIEKLWHDKTYDVVRLDFSGLNEFADGEDFQQRLQSFWLSKFAPLGFAYSHDSGIDFIDQFKVWLDSREYSSLVVLIDEYDAPLTSNLDNQEVFDSICRTLSKFYLALKEYEGVLRFFFMTGMTKACNAKIFSSFNILKNISGKTQYGSILGFTEEEIAYNFSAYLHRASQSLDITDDDLMGQLAEHYGGYCFETRAEVHVFTPWSVLNFLDDPKSGFVNYWYGSGGKPAVLKKYLKNHLLRAPLEASEHTEIRLQELYSSQAYDDIDANTLLLQTGYYTIRSVTDDGYAILGCPNREVAASVTKLYTDDQNGEKGPAVQVS